MALIALLLAQFQAALAVGNMVLAIALQAALAVLGVIVTI